MHNYRRIAITLSSLSLALGACTQDDPVVDDDPVVTPAPVDDTPGVAAARAHLVAAVPELTAEDVEVTRAGLDELGQTHVRTQQRSAGMPVVGGEAIVHLDAAGDLRGITDDLVRDIAVDSTPSLTADDAIDLAITATGGPDQLTADPTAELAVTRDDDGDHLVWRVELERLPPDDVDAWARPEVLVDAHDGAIRHQWDRILDIEASATGTARYVGSVSFKTWADPDGSYYLEDLTHRIAVGDLDNGAQNEDVDRVIDSNNVWTGDSTAVQLHWGLGKTHDYYRTTFGRNGIDGMNAPGYIISKSGAGKQQTGLVHWGNRANNAKWVDPYMVFGDGDGTAYGPLVDLDIVAHEWTHGVTNRAAQIGGSGESPALKEHIADAFAASVDAWVYGGATSATWKIGEQAFTPGVAGDATRYLNDPALRNGAVDYYRSDLDTADPHDGAGVGNLAFYLVSQGGDHPRRDTAHVTGVGIALAQRVWYQALTGYLTSSAEYDDLRAGTLIAAADIYGAGGSVYRAVHSAWAAVGLPQDRPEGFSVIHPGTLTEGASVGTSSGSFLSNDGSVVGFLGHDQTDDFDLELYTYDWSLGAWKRIRTATGPGNNEAISHSAGAAAWYYWRVIATRGSGHYSLGWNP